MNIKTLLQGAAAALVLAASPAFAYTPDTKTCSTTLGNSGSGGQETWAESCLNGTDLTYIDDNIGIDDVEVDGSGNFYIDVDPDEPSYFVLKFGVGNTGVDTHYLFTNIAELTKLVWTNAQINGLMTGCLTTGDCKISHYSTFSGSSSSSSSSSSSTSSGTVSEPGTSAIALLGLGMLGLALRARRRGKSA
jgi:PEP-CTERM motif